MTPQEEKTFLQWQGDCLRAETALEALDQDNQRMRRHINWAIEALEANSTSAPVVETLKAALGVQQEAKVTEETKA